MIRQDLTYNTVMEVIKNKSDKYTLGIDNMLPYIDGYLVPGSSMAVIDNNKPVAAFGIFPLWDGVGEAWMIPSKYHLEKPISLARHLKKGFFEIAENMKLRRAQAAVKDSYDMGSKLLKFVGFEFEGDMPQYGPDGNDYKRFAVLWQTSYQ